MSFRVILAYLRKLPVNQAAAPRARQLWRPTARNQRDGSGLPWGRLDRSGVKMFKKRAVISYPRNARLYRVKTFLRALGIDITFSREGRSAPSAASATKDHDRGQNNLNRPISFRFGRR